MNVEMDRSLSAPASVQTNRRRFLSRILALPAALAALPLSERLFGTDVASGKKKKHKKRRNRSRRPGSSGAKAYSPDSEELAFFELLNAYRTESGVGRLALNGRLGAAAEHHSQDMADNNYTSHNLSNGDSPLKNIERFGYDNFIYWGEVIAAGFETAEQAISALKTSPPHDQMMRKQKLDHCGIGRAYHADADWEWYWTITFGGK